MDLIDAFKLIEQRGDEVRQIAERAAAGTEMSRKAIYHLIGLSGYISDLAQTMKADLDNRKI